MKQIGAGGRGEVLSGLDLTDTVKQMSSSSFHMFIYARIEQCDFIGGPTYLFNHLKVIQSCSFT